jgi:hypothetical protein
MPTSVIRVSRSNITTNRERGERAPVVTVWCDQTIVSGNGCEILGPSRIVYDGDSCWIETEAEVRIQR